MAEADGSIFREDPKGNGWRSSFARTARDNQCGYRERLAAEEIS